MIDVSADKYGNVTFRHSRYAEAEPGRSTFTMTGHEFNDLRWRMACYELEDWKLPRTVPLGDVLGAQFRRGYPGKPGPSAPPADQLAGR